MQHAIKDFESAVGFYLKDLESMTDEQILGSAGGNARKPVDFTYEVAKINRRAAMRLRGETPPKDDSEGWDVAPEELRSRDAIAAFFKQTCDEVVEAASAVPAGEEGKMVGTPGHERPAYAMVFFLQMHAMYHDAQLNYIQSLAGDLEMHWF